MISKHKEAVRKLVEAGKEVYIIKCTRSNSAYVDVHNNPDISWLERTTKLEHDLFCYLGTDIFVQQYIVHHDLSMGGYKEPPKCPRPSDCPICANRAYLESLGELEPRETGDERVDRQLAMNFDYYRSEPFWAKNWMLLKNEFVVKHTPKCRKCKRIIDFGVIFGCDGWVKRARKGICYGCDTEFQREMRRWQQSSHRRVGKPRKIKEHDAYSLGKEQKALETFF